MDIITRIERYRDTHAAQSGPEGPRLIAQGLVDRYRGANVDAYRRNKMTGAQIDLALGSTITGFLINKGLSNSFDPLLLHMPVFQRKLSLVAAPKRRDVVCALLHQQIAQLAVMHCNMLGAAILLVRMRPVAAWHMYIFEDDQSRICSIFALEFLLGLPVYGAFVVAEAAAAAGRRALDAWV